MSEGLQDGQGSSFWDRLRRRKVAQWGVAYAAGAWGLLQGLQFLAEAFGWPSRVLQLGTVAALIGLPIALALAWFHGERGEQRVGRVELAVVTVLFLVGGALFWRYQHATDAPASAAVEAAPQAAEGARGDADLRPSIAVLPFDNRSAQQDGAFFVDGIHDDILTQLSKVSALQVISRTSVERFRDTTVPIREIARQLGVASILEGGVQRAGDRVRINVQLIDAASDAHLWAETYDRDLTAADIFAIQSEVAAAIAGALKATLSPQEQDRIDAVPTRSLEAWEAYQLGRQRMARRNTESLDEAERFFREAIEHDPEFALAHVGLADTLKLQTEYGARPLDRGLAEAEQAASQALALDPGLAEAWTSKGGIATSRSAYAQAEELLRRAIELNPNYATAHHWLGAALMEDGRPQEGLVHSERAAQLDPLSVIVQLNLGYALELLGRFDDAAARYDRAIQIDPASASAYRRLAEVNAYARNRYDEALPLQQRALALDPGSPLLHGMLAWLWFDLGDLEQARELQATALVRWPDSLWTNSLAASVAAALGDDAAAERHGGKVLALLPREVFALGILASIDLRRGTPQNARSRYASAFPELLDPAGPGVDARNLLAAVTLAAVLQATKEDALAAKLLDASARTLAGMPRLGPGGFGIADVSVYALRGDAALALAALRQAERAGWRNGWRIARDVDPTLASIRGEPLFEAVFADIERDMAGQRAALANRARDAATSPAAE